ncbi:MAG: AAA family ATPase [Candidatus Dormibacteria bacterium]
MPRYLQQLGARGALRASICRAVLDPLTAPLYDEPRTVLSMELTEPTIHFTLLATLARRKESSLADRTSATGLDRGLLGRYLNVMRELLLVDAAAPMFSPARHQHRYRGRDNLMRFWFAYVFPNQGILSSLDDVSPFFDAAIAPHIPEFVSWAFEPGPKWLSQNWILW